MKVEAELPSEAEEDSGEGRKGSSKEVRGGVFNTHAFAWNILYRAGVYTTYTMKC